MNNINPSAILRSTNEVRLTSVNTPQKKDIEKKTIAAGKEPFKSLATALNTSPLKGREITEGPPDEDEDFSFLQDVLCVAVNLASEFDEGTDTMTVVNHFDEDFNDLVQENASEFENVQEVKTQEKSSIVNAIVEHETIGKVDIVLTQDVTSLEEDMAIADIMMTDIDRLFEHATIRIMRQDGSFEVKLARDVTPEESRNSKPTDLGLVIGNRYFVHPKAELKAGSVITLHVNGQPMQLTVAHMRQDQADKLGAIYKGYVDQRFGIDVMKGKKDNYQLLVENFISERLMPKDLRHEYQKEKLNVNRSGFYISLSKLASDKKAAEDAALLKDARDRDVKADEIKRNAENKEIRKEEMKHDESKKMSVEEDTVTVMQAPIHEPSNRKPSAIRVKTSKKNSVGKAQE